MQQKRLVLALLISTAILFLWSYLIPVKPPEPQNSNPAATPTPNQPPPSATPQPTPVAMSSPSIQDALPRRTVTIKTPLYEAKLDSRGGEIVSWIIKQNKDSSRPIYSINGNNAPLELISPQGLNREPRQVPLQLQTGDEATDFVLRSSSYRVEGVESESGDAEVNILGSEKKQLTFSLNDPSTGLVVTKSITFAADDYVTDFAVIAKRGEQVLPV